MTGEGRDLLDRCTFEVRSLDGEGLGTAVLVAADRVLTCAHVVEEMEEVDLAEDASAAPLRRATTNLDAPPDDPWTVAATPGVETREKAAGIVKGDLPKPPLPVEILGAQSKDGVGALL